MEFQTEIDVANRGLQHCGASRIDPTLGFAEISKNAAEVSSCFGKLREAELRRNVWTFACREDIPLRAIDTGTMLLAPTMWVQATTYFVGSITADDSGNLWSSNSPSNLGNDPRNSLTWEPYFGPLTVSPYDSDTSYYAGELVYTAPGDGTYRVYLSLQSGNEDDPAVATAWDADATYSKNQVISYLGTAYISLIDLNSGQVPSASPAPWNGGASYNIGNTVAGSDGVIYSSLGSGNTGHDPVTDFGVHWLSLGVPVPWATSFVGGTGSNKWLQIGGAEFPMGVGLVTLKPLYPLGAGRRNMFKLPSGFLREAPQNPKQGLNPLGGPSGITYNDWTFAAGYLRSSDPGPILFRCVINVTDVRLMDPMFCEGLAARIGLEVCEPLTQSSAKLGTIAKVYDEWMSQARTVNAIEQGYDEPPDDDFITVRN